MRRFTARGSTLCWRGCSLLGGAVALATALAPPLATLAEARLSAHMVQHLVLTLVAAPLLALGAPAVVLPRRLRRLHGAGWRRVLAATGALSARPWLAWAAHTVTVWLWHTPRLYEAALQNNLAHGLEHASLLATAVAFWWMLVDRRGRRHLGPGGGVLYLFTAAMQCSLLGALMASAESVWYATYAAHAPISTHLALEDQHLAGLIMWIPAGGVYLVAALVLLGRWLVDLEARTTAAARSILVVVAVTSASALGGCTSGPEPWDQVVASGDRRRGMAALRTHGCGACHAIPGLAGPHGVAGPSLGGFADRPYIAGVLPNTAGNLVRWIQDPRAIAPGTFMPGLGLTEAEARDIATYLYSLGGFK